MLYDAVEDPGSTAPDALRRAYEEQLRAVVSAHGAESVAAESGISAETLRRLAAGDSPTLTLEEAAAVLAVGEGAPDAEAIVYEVRDHLLMGMTTGVLDVDTIATEIDRDLTGQELQQALEGRVPMTLSDLAAIHAFIAGRNDR